MARHQSQTLISSGQDVFCILNAYLDRLPCFGQKKFLRDGVRLSRIVLRLNENGCTNVEFVQIAEDFTVRRVVPV